MGRIIYKRSILLTAYIVYVNEAKQEYYCNLIIYFGKLNFGFIIKSIHHHKDKI